MIKWLHHLFNPHCESCALAFERNRLCQSCETLRAELERANYEKRQLLDLLITKNTPDTRDIRNEVPEIIRPRHIPWSVKQQQLEAEDRKTAELMRAKQKEIDELENQIIPDLSGSGNDLRMQNNAR